MAVYRVLNISNNLPGYPMSVKDTTEFPELVKYVQDEQVILIMDEETKEVYPAEEFFLMVDLERFEVIE